MVCRTFVILFFSGCLILNNKMLDVTGICFKEQSTMVGTVFDETGTCCYDVVLIKQYLVK